MMVGPQLHRGPGPFVPADQPPVARGPPGSTKKHGREDLDRAYHQAANLAGKDSVKSPMVLGFAAADYPPHTATAVASTSHAGMTIVLVLLIAALCVVFWRATLRLIAIAVIALLISGALMAFHMHG